MSAGSGPEHRQERLDESLDKIRKLVEQAQNRLSLDDLRLSERYVAAELWLHVHVRVTLGDPEDLCFIFNGVTPSVLGEYEWGWRLSATQGLVPDFSRLLDIECHHAADEHCRQQHMVFVRDVQSVQLIKQVVPAFVWSERLDTVHGRLRKALYLSKTGTNFVGMFEDPELSEIRVRSLSIRKDELPDQKIERRAQIVHGITSDSPEPRRGLPLQQNAINDVLGLRVVIGDDFIWAAIPKCLDFRCEITDVLFGPFDLDPEAGRPIRHEG